MSLQTTEQLVAVAMTESETLTPAEIAKKVGISTQARPVREAIKVARQVLAGAAEKYVELHMLATEVAALKGDATPSQWALERIAEGGARVVDAPKTGPTGPGLRIGIAVGGVPTQRSLPPSVSLDDVAVEADVTEATP